MAVLISYIARRWRIALLVTVGIAALGFSGGNLQANRSGLGLSGPIRVIDGDTFEVAGTKVRLHAIDAPESDQICQTKQGKDWACGGWVTKVVSDRYSGMTANCEAVDTDRYGRTVARCTALGEDVGGWLVREGMAFAYPKYGADYVALERRAAARDRGLHAVKMQTPEQHRRLGKPEVKQPANGDCKIKGNMTAKGDRIYHVPGQKYYDKTRISLNKGEHWFCSEAEARTAGWRKSRI